MKIRIAAAILAAFASCATHARTVAVDDTWNLERLYPDTAAWDADSAKLDAQMAELVRCAGKLGESAARLRQCLDLRADMYKRILRMNVYSSEKFSGDTTVPANLELQQRTEVLFSKLQEAQAFLKPEILRIGRERIDAFLAQDPGLAIHRHPLDDILRMAPHTLDEKGEALVARFGLMSGAGSSVYTTLHNADLPWPTVQLSTGAKVRLDASAYTKYREVPNRADRKKVMDTFFAAHKAYERTFGITLYSQLKEDSVHAKVRSYPDSITAALNRDRLPVAIMDTLVAQTNANLGTLHRYFKLRARILGVPQMRYYDIYPPLVKSARKFPIEEGKRLTLEAVAPLGPDYVAAVRHGFENRWMDVYPRKGKQSGAHVHGSAYDVHPYVLMNYNDDYASLTTLAHEWGHAAHSHLSNKAQPFVTSDYATFIAEIASTVNEELLLERMLRDAKNDEDRLFYLGSALELMRATFFRQAMFAEFEKNVHGRVDSGESLTGDSFTKTYCDILKRHHGHDKGVVTIDDAYCLEWAYIPHFYNGFYVYQYATSISAGSLFAQRILAKEPGARDRYLALLKAGGSDYPYELVKKAGVDLATPAPYQAIIARMESIMDEIEKILARRRK